jgi:hypothetical protein
MEGPEALENFEKISTAIFQKPKAGGRKTRKKSSKAAGERKLKRLRQGLGVRLPRPKFDPPAPRD